jgi:hypothetical protein
MCAGLKRSMPCDNLNELEVVVVKSSGTRFLDESLVCDFKRQRTSISSVSVASSSDDDCCSQASPVSFCDSHSSSSSNPATAALEEALALSSEELDIAIPEMDAVQVFFDFSFQHDMMEYNYSSLQNVDDMTRAMVRMTTISNQA